MFSKVLAVYKRKSFSQRFANDSYEDWDTVFWNVAHSLVSTGLFKMIVGVLTTCHTKSTSDSSIYFFYLIEQHSKVLLHNLQVLYMCTFCDSTNINKIMKCKHTKIFSLPFAAILVNCAPSGEMHNYCTPHIIKENFENF